MKPNQRPAIIGALALAAATVAAGLAGYSAHADKPADDSYHRDYIYGAPAAPSEAWLIASGARLYDNWFVPFKKPPPAGNHPAWPASNTAQKGGVTWRCKSCHGWDFKGKDGRYASGPYRTGIKGINGMAGKEVARIERIIADDTHRFTADLIPPEAVKRIAVFVALGQYDTAAYITDKGEVRGDLARGAAIYQTTCASCHGFDGKARSSPEEKEPLHVGAEANANPWEVLYKIRFGHAGYQMTSLVAFPIQDSVDVLAYSKTLPLR